MSNCQHVNFDAQNIVNRLEESGLFNMDVKVWCRDCSLPFEFPETISIGLDLHGVSRSLSGQELRIAIAPATWPDDWSDRDIRDEGEESFCHCGRLVVFGYDGDPTHHRGMCAECDAARCDAYPDECPFRRTGEATDD